MRPRHTARAFTLIELLTVIAIIGVLAAIIIPVVGNGRASAQKAECLSNLRQIGLSLRLYAGDRANRLPCVFGVNPGVTGDSDWSAALAPYLTPRSNGLPNGVFVCPSADFADAPPGEIHRTYSAGGAFSGLTPAADDNAPSVPRALSSIASPSRSVWLIEGTRQLPGASSPLSIGYEKLASDLGVANTVSLSFRHREAAGVLFADGAVRCSTREELARSLPTKSAWLGVD